MFFLFKDSTQYHLISLQKSVAESKALYKVSIKKSTSYIIISPELIMYKEALLFSKGTLLEVQIYKLQ